MKAGIGSHTLPNKGATDDWITPKYIIDALGPFDLDPCQSVTQPWPCASKGYTVTDDGLSKKWDGFVYVNAPYSNAEPFMNRLAEHRLGFGLLFGRTETDMFSRHIWEEADAVLFIRGRLHFHYPDGSRDQPCPDDRHAWSGRPDSPKTKWCPLCGKAKGNSGGPSVIVAYGDVAVKRLRDRFGSTLSGALVTKWEFRSSEPKGAAYSCHSQRKHSP